MTTSPADTRILLAHVENTVDAIARLHAEHCKGATPLQRAIDRATARAGQPSFVAFLAIIVLTWMAFNLAVVAFEHKPWTSRPFSVGRVPSL